MEVDFESMYKIAIVAMKINRSHPEIPRNFKWILQFFFLQGLYTIVYCLIAYNIVLAIENRDFFDACRHSVLSVLYYAVSFQYFFLVRKQKTMNKLIKMMKDDFKKDLPRGEKRIVFDYAQKGSRVCRYWAVIPIITEAVFPLKHIILEIYLYATGAFEVLMMYPLTLPAPLEEYKMQPLMFTMLYVMMLFYGSYSASMYLSFVPLGLSFTLHACGQLEILKQRILDLFNKEGDVNEKLIEILKNLKYVYDFVDCITDTFEIVYEIILKACSVLLPIAVYEVLAAFHQGQISFEFISFTIAGTLLCGMPCYYSDMLKEKGDGVRQAIYNCGWEAHYNRNVRMTLVIILQRTIRPISIRTVFRTICLDTFTDVLHQAYAIFNLMNAAWG